MDPSVLAASLPAGWSSLAMGVVVLALAGLLTVVNQRSRRRRERESLSGDARAFFTRQYQRRRWLNRLIGVTGLGILCGPLVSQPLIRLGYWIGIALILGWISLLAIWDFAASFVFLQSLRANQKATRMAIQSRLEELDRHGRRSSGPAKTTNKRDAKRSEGGNGQDGR